MPRRLSDDPLRTDTDVREPVVQGSGGLKERLEPAVSEGLEVADQLEKTQLPLLAGPQRGAESRTEGIGQHDQQQTSVEITERGLRGLGGPGGEVEITFPGLEHEFHLPP